MGKNTELTWQEIAEYMQEKHEIKKEWFINSKVSLKDKFVVINMFKDYMELMALNENFDLDISFYELEICKRMLMIGIYMNIVPIMSDCNIETYEILEEEKFFNNFIQFIDKQDFDEFSGLMENYININMTCYLRTLGHIFQETQKTNISQVTELLTNNADVIEKINNIIDFNNPD